MGVYCPIFWTVFARFWVGLGVGYLPVEMAMTMMMALVLLTLGNFGIWTMVAFAGG